MNHIKLRDQILSPQWHLCFYEVSGESACATKTPSTEKPTVSDTLNCNKCILLSLAVCVSIALCQCVSFVTIAMAVVRFLDASESASRLAFFPFRQAAWPAATELSNMEVERSHFASTLIARNSVGPIR